MSESDHPTDSFAALFAQQLAEKGQKKLIRRELPRVGEVVEATVLQIGRDSVFVELEGQRQAFIEASELRAPDGTMAIAVGATLRAQVVSVEDGNVRLGRSLGKAGSSAQLEQARESGVPVEGKVTKLNKGGLEVEVGGTRAFCPMSQIEAKFVQDASVYVGKSLQFIVTEIKDGGRSVTLSRRLLLEREARESAARAMKDVTVGAVLRGTVTGVREFGAFVDLGGIEGLIPASELTYDRSVAAADAVTVGDTVTVQVLDVKEVAGKRQNERVTKVTLSLKALAKDPWEDVDSVVTVGKVTSGTVTRIADFGAFVKLAAGVEGLLHISEMGGKPDSAQRAFQVGQVVSVVVRSLDKAAKKVSLVPAPEGMSVGASVQATRIGVGSIVKGTVDRIETFGVFLQIEGTSGRAGRGLLPNAEMGVPRGTDVRKTFPEGTKLTAKVLEVADGRIRLSLRAVKDDEERSQFEGFRENVKATATMGTFADLLKGKKK